MGKMNEISLLAHDCGWQQYADIDELRVLCAKYLLDHLKPAPEYIALRVALKLPEKRDELAALVAVTKEQAVKLRSGAVLHHIDMRGSDKLPVRVRVSGKCRIWARYPHKWRLPVKYGLYQNSEITNYSAHEWYVA